MIKNQKVLGLITARGGSKRLPKKNLTGLGGKSLIRWTVDAAKQSGYIDRLIMSSDSQAIIDEAGKSGCEVPFVRAGDLAGDEASSVDVALHALEQMGWKNGFLVLLQPTSPFRRTDDIDACIRACSDDGVMACVSVSEPDKPAKWLLEDKSQGYIAPVFPDDFSDATDIDRQFYFPNGAVFVVRVADFIREKTFWPKETKFVVMEKKRSLDIDTQDDLDYANYIYQAMKD